MTDVGKMLFFLGLVVMLIGALAWGLGRMGFKGLPGDIHYQGQNWGISFPIVTCIVLSVILTLGMALWNWLRRGS